MTIQTHFNKFNGEIYLTNQSPAYKKAKEKDDSILTAIKAKFLKEGYKVEDSFLQGSFAVDTAIKNADGDYDIDRSIVISADNAPADPLEPKNAILDVLEKRNFQNPKVKMPCVTADYLSTNLHLDFTVYAKDSNDNYQLAVGKKGSSNDIKKWSDADPKGLIEWIKSTDGYSESLTAKRKQFKRLVRYMKRWRDVTFGEAVKKKIFSIGLTIMIKESYKPSYRATEVDDDLTALKQVVDGMLNGNYLQIAAFNPDEYRVSVKLPCHLDRNIFNHKTGYGYSEQGSDKNTGTQLKNKLTTLQNQLQKALDETDEIKQCETLNSVFGDDFKIPEKSSNGKATKAAATSSLFSSAGAAGTSQGAVAK